jgi:hypothetical protein
MENLTLDSLKEPSGPSSSTGHGSRRHTVSIHPDDKDPFMAKVPARTLAAIEKVAEIVNRMGGQVRTHVQDNGGLSTPEVD